MQTTSDQELSKRRPINLTIREDVLKEAKSLKLNASKAAEAGLVHAIKEAHAKEWLEVNKQALIAHNKRVEKDGTFLKPNWASE